jgi:hypothetical protein
LIVILVLLSGIVGGLYRGMKAEPDPDWRAFSRESRYVWQHRTIPPETSMFGYLPAAFFALWPFTVWTPEPLGLIAFVTLNALATIGSLFILRRWWFDRPLASVGGAFVWPVLLTVGHFQHVLQANQLTIWVLLLGVVGLTLLMHQRQCLGGFVLGLAGCVKVTPFVFLVYLLLRRQWRALSGMLLAVFLCQVLPSIVFFGPAGAIREHRGWWQRVGWYSNRRMIEDPLLRVRRHGHNCSYSVVLGRWLRPAPEARFQLVLAGNPPAEAIEEARANLRADEYLVLDPQPTPGTTWSIRRDEIPNVPRYRIAGLSARAVWLIWASTLAMAMGALAWATYRCRNIAPGGPGWRAEAAVWMLLMFWPTPMMRDYYLALALPAYLVIWRAVLGQSLSEKRGPGGRMAIGALAFFPVGGMVALAWNAANWYGLHLATVAVLAGAAVWAWRVAHAQGPVGPTFQSVTKPGRGDSVNTGDSVLLLMCHSWDDSPLTHGVGRAI